MNYIIIAFVVALALVGWDDHSVRKDNAQLLTNQGIYKAQVDTLTGNVGVLKTTIANNNKAVDDLTSQAVTREAKVKEAVKAAGIASDSNKKLADFLLAARPDPTKDICTATNALFDEYLDKRKVNRETTH